jgi:hypothetical protein
MPAGLRSASATLALATLCPVLTHCQPPREAGLTLRSPGEKVVDLNLYEK